MFEYFGLLTNEVCDAKVKPRPAIARNSTIKSNEIWKVANSDIFLRNLNIKNGKQKKI